MDAPDTPLPIRTGRLWQTVCGRVGRAVALACAAVALAVALTWPLLPAATTHLPTGTETVPTVPLLNAWTIWWNADRAADGFQDYWNAPIFVPVENAFAFSEAQPTSLLVAPLMSATRPALAYNVYLLAVLTLNGLMAYRLLRRGGLAVVPAALGGAMLEALPIVHWQLGVLQLTTICGILWFFERFDALARQPTLLRGLWLGCAAAACYAACNYFGLFLSVIVPVAALPLVRRPLDLRFWLYGALAALLAATLVLPILLAQWQAKAENQWQRPENLLVSLSAQPGDYTLPPWPAWIAGPNYSDPARWGWMLGPGIIKLTLAILGVCAGLIVRRHRRWTLALLLLGGFAFALSLGPGPTLLDGDPYRKLMSVHPGLALARSPFRFAYFVQIAVGLLAAILLDVLWSARRRTQRLSMWPRRVALGTVVSTTIGLGIAATGEVWPAAQPLHELPDAAQHAEWVAWLGSHTAADEPILCVPFVEGSTVEEYQPEAQAMHFQTLHGRPLVGGYSGFFPTVFLDLKAEMPYFPDDQSIALLKSRGVRYVVAFTPAAAEQVETAPGAVPAVLHDVRAKVSIYEIR